MTERTRSAYDHWAASYDTDPNPQNALEYQPVLEALDAKAGERILDAACGTGRYTKPLHEAGAEMVGLDFSEAMLAKARERLPEVEFVRGDLSEPLPFADASFDAILCGQALKHLPDLHVPMREFARLLRPGGRLVFSVTHPDMNWDGYELRPYDGYVMRAHADVFHHRFFDYFDAVETAGLSCRRILQLKVSEEIRSFLTDESFAIVQGRPQILVMVLAKP